MSMIERLKNLFYKISNIKLPLLWAVLYIIFHIIISYKFRIIQKNNGQVSCLRSSCRFFGPLSIFFSLSCILCNNFLGVPPFTVQRDVTFRDSIKIPINFSVVAVERIAKYGDGNFRELKFHSSAE